MPEQRPVHPFTVRKIVLEVKVEHEVELTRAHVDALHVANVAAAGGEPYAILVEKTNHYSYSFDALTSILEQPLVFAMAFYIGSEAQRPAVKTLLAFSEQTRKFPAAIFTSRREAIAWLVQHGADVESALRR
jgi:hypothetical protein